MLTILKHDLLTAASRLPKPYESYKIDELANGYLKATEDQDECGRDMYYSALVLRFWYRIDHLYCDNRTILPDHAAAFDWLVDGINLALYYKGWLNPKKHLNAQQCIQRCIATIRLRRYYDANLPKNRIHNGRHCMSLDAKMNDDNEDTWADAYPSPDDQYAKIDAELETRGLVQACIDDKKIVQAIILDTIAYKDCERSIKKTYKLVDEEIGKTYSYTTVGYEFQPRRLIKLLGALPEDYADYFSNKYIVKAEELNAALESVRKSNNQKLYKFVDSTLNDFRDTMRAKA